VVAVDLSPAQLALVALKRAAFLTLDHAPLLGFLGVRRAARDRREVYATLRRRLDPASRDYWDRHAADIAGGVVHAGRLERYFRLFKRWVLPLAHRAGTVESLFVPRPREQRERFYREVWDTRAWRAVCRAFFSRAAMGRLGRDPEFFRHAPGSVAAHVLERARHAMTELPTEDNPYLRYVLTASFDGALPDYLRPEHYQAIRARLGRLQLRYGAIEAVLAELPARSVHAFNLSDVAEYMDLGAYHRLLDGVRRAAAPGARVVYWNLLAERRRPAEMAAWLEAREREAAALHAEARAFFYRALVVEVAR
jgi:S-adenosylmethionine-diacylglycerol 3-amino-3-carboxypropyl transferase